MLAEGVALQSSLPAVQWTVRLDKHPLSERDTKPTYKRTVYCIAITNLLGKEKNPGGKFPFLIA